MAFSLADPLNYVFGGKSKEQDRLNTLAKATYYSSGMQAYLPQALRAKQTDPLFSSAMSQIGNLINNPGGLNPNVADAIRPYLASQSQQIGQNFQNMQSQNAGMAARGNMPVSIKGALQNALDVSQERAQREAQMGALSQSESLRRSDLNQFYQLLDTILKFTSTGRGQGLEGMGAATQAELARQKQRDENAWKMVSMIMGGAGGGI